MATFCDQQINQEHPLLSATLPSGERIQFVIPPAVTRGTVSITVRKPSASIKRLDDFERDGFKNPGPTVCKKCHDKDLSVAHHAGLGAAATDCQTCHLFAPGQVAQTCIGCHGKPQGTLAAIVSHAKVDCAKCHGTPATRLKAANLNRASQL